MYLRQPEEQCIINALEANYCLILNEEIMGFGGSAQAMVTAIKNNKDMLSKRKDKKLSFVGKASEKPEFDLPKATPRQLKEIRDNMRREHKKRRVKQIVFITVVMSVILIALSFYF